MDEQTSDKETFDAKAEIRRLQFQVTLQGIAIVVVAVGGLLLSFRLLVS